MTSAIQLGQLELLVLQPTPFCNLDCTYCYLPNRNNPAKMSAATLRNTLRAIFSSELDSSNFTIVWHAGEPLALSTEWYSDALAIVDEETPDGVIIRHSMQSNGTLLTDDWCNFLITHNINLGISIDGPASINDRFRVDRAGRGTYEKTIRGIRLLQSHNIDFHIISVLTADSLQHADELFDFYVENNLRRIGFNVEEQEGINIESSLQGTGIEESARQFFGRFLQRNLDAGWPIQVREFEQIFGIVQYGLNSIQKNPQTEPWAIVTVNSDGGISNFSPELAGLHDEHYGRFEIGNLNNESIAECAANPRFKIMTEDITTGVNACRKECHYFNVCFGGAPSNKLAETGSFTSTETNYCRLHHQVISDIVLEHIESALDKVAPLPADGTD